MYLKNNVLMWLITLVCIFLCGCSSELVIKRFNPNDTNIDGVPFYLSKPYLLRTKYFVGTVAEPTLITEEVIYLPDPKERYVATYRPAPFASADFNIEYGANPGSVVSKISMASTPPGPEKLAEAAGKLFGAKSEPSQWPLFLRDKAGSAGSLRIQIEISPLNVPSS